MRLNELTPSTAKKLRKQKTAKNVEIIEDWLKENGYDYIGGGVFGAVFTRKDKKSNAVIKVAMDECYRKYVEFCRKYKNNPYYPKVSPIHTIKAEEKNRYANDNITVVFLEKLMSIHEARGEGLLDAEEFKKIVRIGQSFKEREFLTGLSEEEKQTDFYKAIYAIHSAFQDVCKLDTHEYNIMYRTSTKTPVITDPVSFLLTDTWIKDPEGGKDFRGKTIMVKKHADVDNIEI